MTTGQGFRWASVIFGFAATYLAAYSSAVVPVNLVKVVLTMWGSGSIPPKIVMEQKAYSAGALLAITGAVISQLLALLPRDIGLGFYGLLASILLALAIVLHTTRRARTLVNILLAIQAKSRNEGRLIEVERVKNPANPESFVEGMGLLYGRARKKGEQMGIYRQRLAEHIEQLARE